jgi:hypothetical protein
MRFISDLPKKEKRPGAIRVANLDQLLGRDQIVTLHGVDHVLKVPEFLQWLEFASAQTELLALKDKENIKPDELIKAYHKFISKICPTITELDIAKCTQQQVSQLWQICMDLMNGYSKKKTQASLLLLNLSNQEVDRMIQTLSQLRSMPPEL